MNKVATLKIQKKSGIKSIKISQENICKIFLKILQDFERSDHTQKHQNPTVLSGAEKEQKRAVALVM